jgi:hypothetical protein
MAMARDVSQPNHSPKWTHPEPNDQNMYNMVSIPWFSFDMVFLQDFFETCTSPGDHLSFWLLPGTLGIGLGGRKHPAAAVEDGTPPKNKDMVSKPGYGM